MATHEIVGSVSVDGEDVVSVVVNAEITSDKLPDDPRIYMFFMVGGKSMMVAFPLKEIFKTITKELLSN